MGEGQRKQFEGVTDFFSELARMRQVGTYGNPMGHEGSQRTHATAWVPATDIFARGEDLGIRIDLAGVHPDDVSVTFTQGVLTVSGERRTWQDTDGDDSFQIRERFYGTFRRAINLPEGTQESQISAEFEDGQLELIVTGGAAASEPARIAVRAKGRAR
jgi:HSP20 family protein